MNIPKEAALAALKMASMCATVSFSVTLAPVAGQFDPGGAEYIVLRIDEDHRGIASVPVHLSASFLSESGVTACHVDLDAR
jgi:hypothetical protein